MRAQQSEPPVDYFYISSLGDPGDGDWWYSIATADGTPFAIFPFQWTCGSCTGAPIPIGAGCSLLPAGGVTATWNGEAVTGVSTCQTTEANGETATLGCDTTRCMPAGQYIVTMCATASPSSCLERGTDAGQTCVSVPFDYPTASVVVGELPP